MHRLAAFAIAFAISAISARAIAACPSDEAITLANRADAVGQANLDAAIALLVQATDRDPSNARILFKLARAYVKKENWKNVARTITAARKLAPTFATYHWLEGFAFMKQSAWPEAKSAFEQAIALDPNYADPSYDLATTLEHLGDEQGALAYYTRAIRLAPSRTDAYPALADLYRRLGYLDQAAAVAREGLAWNPPPHVHFTLATLAGAVAEERKAMTEAVTRYREAKDACGACDERGEAIAHFNLGMALAASKPPKNAEATDELVAFQKRVCRGAAALRYADECAETQSVLRRLGGP
jgi:tetratricopeptide (TPR) repeat protein